MWSIVSRDDKLLKKIVPMLKRQFSSRKIFIEDLNTTMSNTNLLNAADRKLTIVLVTPNNPYFYIQDSEKNIVFTNKNAESNNKNEFPVHEIFYSYHEPLTYDKVVLHLVKKYRFNKISQMRLQTFYSLAIGKEPACTFLVEEFDDRFSKYDISMSNKQLLGCGFIHFPFHKSTEVVVDELFYKTICEMESELITEDWKKINKEKRRRT